MNRLQLEAYLHSHIPLSAAMQVKVEKADLNEIRLAAPLAPNINHTGTAFGGSIATLATLAGWSVLRLLTDHLTPAPRLVIRRSKVEYIAPIDGAFVAISCAPNDEGRAKFLHQLADKGKARLSLEVAIVCNQRIRATQRGDFVALTL